MTKFRLNAGRPATPARGGSSALSQKEPVEVTPRKYWAPNTEPPTPLKCGDSIPWPIVQLIGPAPGNPHRVWCDKHGWTDVREEDPRCQTQQQSIFPDLPPF